MLRMSCVRRKSFVPKEQSYASPQKPLSRSCADNPSGAWQKYAYNRTYGIIRAKNG